MAGIIPEKMHSLKAYCLWLLSHPITLSFFPPLFVLQIRMVEIPSCTAARAHPSCPQVAARYTAAMAATHALLAN
ncbi:TPA: hypothetical protein HA270_03945 [Candidatus Woesearchaeota archaeon]|nr:hypothetical protein [Candidatus Woesearchaeota archaeon]